VIDQELDDVLRDGALRWPHVVAAVVEDARLENDS
jgi:hypothetical protein